jgi:hypothetical protein
MTSDARPRHYWRHDVGAGGRNKADNSVMIVWSNYTRHERRGRGSLLYNGIAALSFAKR